MDIEPVVLVEPYPSCANYIVVPASTYTTWRMIRSAEEEEMTWKVGQTTSSGRSRHRESISVYELDTPKIGPATDVDTHHVYLEMSSSTFAITFAQYHHFIVGHTAWDNNDHRLRKRNIRGQHSSPGLAWALTVSVKMARR
jgi:hypothetical protein